ncbi:hypothetical protein [Chitinophaga sp. 212800010-3]|uniref:tetratricopeptide repeat protein n=1 Tax=unclassified Chitinophaga TaxID=2619133 RepID=UPI002DED79EC|nr:TPR-REGION domain-containing protein [Chitinophaga sp. 212800010-3]
MYCLMTRATATVIFLLLFLHIQAQQAIDRSQVMEYLQNQQYDNAIGYLQPRINEKDPGQLQLLAYTYYLSGKAREAITTYEKVVALDSNIITAHQYLAALSIQTEAPTMAIPHYLQLLRLQPGNATVTRQLSFAFYAAKQADSGFVWLQRAYALNPADPKVVARLGEALLEHSEHQRADSVVRAFLATDSLQPSVIMVAVRSAWYLKDYARCDTLGNQLMELKSISLNTYAIVAAALYNLKKYKECIGIHEFLQSFQLQSEAVMYYAALSNTALKNYDVSNELLQTCIDLATSKSLDDYYCGKSTNYEGLRQYKTAIANLDTAYYLFRAPLRQYSIGRIYDVSLKNKEQATRYYKRFMQIADRNKKQEADIYKYLHSYVGK